MYVAEEPEKPEGKKASDPPKIDDDGLAERLRKILPSILDEFLGTEDKEPDKPQPKTDREVELSLRDQVKQAVSELERDRAHEKEHEALRAGPPPAPEPEVKPWRQRLWGE